MSDLPGILKDIRACRICEPALGHHARPVVVAESTARICIAGQAPGTRVHNTGIPFNDPSGDRLREWMGIDRDIFYDASHIAIVPMGFCFPGLNDKGGDLPPRKECAATWRDPLFDVLPEMQLTLLVGGYAQKWHLGSECKKTLTETVTAWQDYLPSYLPMPHPSWRNNAWLKKNPWFNDDVLPYLRSRIADLLRDV